MAVAARDDPERQEESQQARFGPYARSAGGIAPCSSRLIRPQKW